MKTTVAPLSRLRFTAITLSAFVLILVIVVSCARGGGVTATNDIRHAALAAPVLNSVNIDSDMRSASGLPGGIRVNWDRVNDPTAIGYYLYRDTKPITGDPWDNVDLRVNGGAMIPQVADDPIYFDDTEFPGGHPIVGQVYYYRVTVVNDTNDESFFSNEVGYPVSGHSVTGFTPASGAYGDNITITGELLNDYDPLLDVVQFPSLTGFLDATIVSWDGDAGEIVATVPEFAITGQIRVIVNGLAAVSQDDFVITSPYLLDIDKEHAAEGDVVVISGANFGTEQGDGEITFAGQEATPFISWGNTLLAVTVPPISPVTTSTVITLNIGGRELGTFDLGIHPTILTPTELLLTASETATITGRHFSDTGTLSVNGTGVIVSSWTPETITAVVDLLWTEGDVVVTTEWASNAIPFVFDSTLYANFPADFDGTLLEAGGSTEITAETNTNTDSIEFLVDGVSYFTDSDGSDGFKCTINADDFANERHAVEMHVTRRSRAMTSDPAYFFSRVFDGDYNGDNVIDTLDVDRLGAYIIQALIDGDTSATLYPTLDGNRDGTIDEMDVAIVGYKFGDVR